MIIKTKASHLCRLANFVPLTILLSAGAPAQQPPTAATEASDQVTIEEVLVTGSRVRQNPLDARDPVQILTFEDFEQSGDVSIGEFLQRLPAHGSAINRTNNASGNLGNPPDGQGVGQGALEMDLRYLSPRRTLVLVDGRRWVGNSSASGVTSAVDLNSIPTNAVQSIEVLLDGASTVYGSDAIGGVINIITRTDYEGFRVSAYSGQYGEGDGASTNVNVSFGSNSERSRSLVALSYTDQGLVSSADREIARWAIPGFESGLSSSTPQGYYWVPDALGKTQYLTLNDGVVNSGRSNGGLPRYDPANPTSGDFHRLTFSDRYNWQPPNYALTPNERTNLLVKSEYDISDRLIGRIFAVFTNRKSASQAAPEPLGFGSQAGGGQFLRSTVIPADQEYNPFGVQLGGPDGIPFRLYRRPVEVGSRRFNQNVDTWHLSGGLDGSFDVAGSNWFWDVTAGFFQSLASQQKRGGFNGRNLALAAGPAEACAAVVRCVPINLFGGQGDGSGSLTPEMLEFVTYVQQDESRHQLFDSSANLSGSLFDLPAGPLGVAAGIAYREEDGYFLPDAVVTAGETAVSPRHASDGSFDVLEYYAEAVIPVASRFDLNAAVRASDYDLFDTESVFKVGAKLSPVDTLTIRASYSEGFRAPNIGELFNLPFEAPSPVADPCSQATGTAAQNCAMLGVPPGFVTQIDRPFVLSGGSVNLSPERSENWTAGFTFDASSLFDGRMGVERLVAEANMYDISVTDAVQSPVAADILNACVRTIDPFFCDSVARAANGEITLISGLIRNIAGIETRGLDLGISLTTREFPIGQFSFNWTSNFMFEYTELDYGPNGEIISTSREGTELGEPGSGRGYPELKSTFLVSWQRGSWSAGITTTYIDELLEPCGGLTASFAWNPTVLALCSDPGTYPSPLGTNTIEAKLYSDLQVSFRPRGMNDSTSISLGVRNLFDEETPVCRSCRINGFDGTIYPFPGQFLYARLTYNPE